MDIALDLMINDEIRDREVRVIDENGEQLGVMPTQQALMLAEERGLDLAKIQPTAKPPVCKLLDYDKYRYEQSRRERENRKPPRAFSAPIRAQNIIQPYQNDSSPIINYTIPIFS